MEWNIIVGMLGTIVGAVISYATFSRNKSKDDKTDGHQTGVMLTELGYIKGSVDGINKKIDRQDERSIELYSRMSAVEASAKQAHRRIDHMESGGGSKPREER